MTTLFELLMGIVLILVVCWIVGGWGEEKPKRSTVKRPIRVPESIKADDPEREWLKRHARLANDD